MGAVRVWVRRPHGMPICSGQGLNGNLDSAEARRVAEFDAEGHSLGERIPARGPRVHPDAIRRCFERHRV